MPLARMKVVGGHLGRGNVLAPMGCHTFKRAPRYLHHESATMLIELDGQQIDLSIVDSAKVRE
jgi:hypothetical protein